MSKTIRTGIVGYGLSGRVFHAPFVDIVDGYELASISTSRPESIELAGKRYPDASIVPDGEGIINNPDLDLVIVTSPNTDHYKWAYEALNAGKHVVVEKPFTVTVDEADKLIDLAKNKGLILTVYHNRRFTSDTKTVKKLLDAGMLGDIVEYETHFDRYRPEPREGAWREEALPGSGILYDLGSHLIDQALWFFGMPKSVTADIKTQRKWAKADDSFDIRLHYSNLTVTLKAGMLCKVAGPTYLIHGVNGSFVKYGLDVQESMLNAGFVPYGQDWGREPEDIWGEIDVDYNGIKIKGKIESEHGDYREYFMNLRDAIWGEAELAVKPEEARDVMYIIEIAIQSSKEGRTIECLK